MTGILLDITSIFAMAVGAVLVSHRLRLPSSIGLLVAGVIAGPHMLGLVRNVHQIELISEIGVVLLLFVIGLEFSLTDLAHMRRQFLVGGSLQFFGTGALIALGVAASGYSAQQSVFIGFTVALSSTAIVLQLLQDRGELDAPHGRSVTATLIYQDIAVVPMMLAAPLLAGASASASSGLLLVLVRVVGVAAFAFLAYRWVVPWLLERITGTHSSEAFLLGVITLCVGIALITQSAGLSLALGAFLAGLIISESDYSHQAVTVMLPFRDVFMSLFFVSIGMLLDIRFLISNPLMVLIALAGVLLLKPLVAGAANLLLGLPLRSSVLAALSLAQLGEFSLVAARTGMAAGLFGQSVFQIILDVSVLSMLFTPAMVAAGPRVAEALSRTPLRRFERRGFSAARVGSAHSYEGHVIIVGFGVTGRNLARTARLAEVPYAVLELNAATVREALESGEPIHFGDASYEEILRHVDADKARAIVVVINDTASARRTVELARRIAPAAYILVRSRYLREVEPLLALGADEVIADELEVSVEIFSRVLSRMLVPREDIKRFIGEVRGDWRRMARTFSRDATSVSDIRVAVPDLTTHTLRLGPGSPLAGHAIADSRLRRDHGVSIIAVTRGSESVPNPQGEFVLESGDVLFVIGPPEWDPREVS